MKTRTQEASDLLKETKQRGAVYWYAYRKREGKLAKKYLGKTADLTFTRLKEVAGVLYADRATGARTNDPAPSPPAPRETVLPHAHPDGSRVDIPLVLIHTPVLATSFGTSHTSTAFA